MSGGEFDIGYQVLSMKNLVVAPMLGIGASGYDIELQKLAGDVTNFGKLLENPGRTSTVSTSSFLLNPHLMITIPISFVGIQLKGGWMFTPTNDGWELADGGKLNTGPTIAKGMPYAEPERGLRRVQQGPRQGEGQAPRPTTTDSVPPDSQRALPAQGSCFCA